MANNNKFRVKNGLLSLESVVIGTSSYGSEILTVVGDSKYTGTFEVNYSTSNTASISINNTSGVNATIANFTSSSSHADGLTITYTGGNDYKLSNEDNFIKFNNDIDGIEIGYNNSVDISFDSSGITFFREPTYNGNVFWNAGNDGANSGLDADLLDGLDSLQFLRSDQDDTMNGSLVINGDLTVTGNTTTVNTEEILLADNIITLNSNYTGSTPSENAGIEVERGTLDNASFTWIEASDKWQIGGVSQGLLIGDSSSLTGTITSFANSFPIEAGGASGVGNGTVYLSGKQGSTFADAGIASFWNQSGVSYGEVLYGGSPKLRATSTGAVTSGNHAVQGTLTVGTGTGGAYIYMDGAGNNRTIYSSAGEIGFLDTTFNYAARLDTNDDWIVEENVYGKSFVDVEDNTYLLDPDGNSVLNQIGIDEYIKHNGDSDTGIQFLGDTIDIQTGGSSRLKADNNFVYAFNDIKGTSFISSADTNYLVDPDGNSQLYNLNVYTGTANAQISIGSSATERFQIQSTDGQGYIRYYQDETNATDHSVNFEIVSGGFGLNRFNFNADVNIGNNDFLGGTISVSSSYASIYYDADNLAYFGDFSNTGTAINTAGRITAAAGTLALPTYSFELDNNTGMYRYGADTIGFSAGGNDEFRITSTYALATGAMRSPIYYDSDNTQYFVDAAGNSQMNTVDIDDYIRHRGDLTTYFGFDTNQRFRVFVNNTSKLSIDLDSADFSVNVYAPRYYDSNDNTYYADPAGTSILSRIDIADYIRHIGDEDTYIGFPAADTFRIFTGGVQRFNIDTDSADFAVNVYAPRYYDSDNNSYFLDPGSASTLGSIGIDSDLFHNGDTDTKLSFTDNQIAFDADSATRLTITSSNVAASVPVRAPYYYATTGTTNYLNVGASSTVTALALSGRIALGNLTDVDRWDDTTGNGGITISPYGAHAATSNPLFAISGGNGNYALSHLNRIDIGNNPLSTNNKFTSYYADGTEILSERGDGLNNFYNVIESTGAWSIIDTGATFGLTVDSSMNVIVGDQSITYANSDATPIIGSINPNKLHVNGSVQLTGSDDAVVFGNGTSSFIKHNELTFGEGGGWYMTDSTYLRVSNNKTIYTSGDIQAGRYLDYSDANYYLDPAGTSVLNRIGIDDYIQHNGDTDNYFGFAANDTFRVWTGNTQRLNIDNDSADFAVNVYSDRFGDISNNNFYIDPNTSNAFRLQTPTGFLDIGSMNASFVQFQTDRPEFYFQKFTKFDGGGISAYSGNDYAYFPTYYDFNDNNFYGDFAGTSVMARITMPQNTVGVSHFGNANLPTYYIGQEMGDTDGWKIYGESPAGTGTGALILEAGNDYDANESIRLRLKKSASPYTSKDALIAYYNYVLASDSFRAPIFYDSNNTSFYTDPASTSVMNNVRGSRFEMDTASRYIDSPNGDYGTIKVEGSTNGYAGYAISNDWAFISDGSTNMGLYNDTRNEWVLYAQDNNFTRLYSNGVHQLSAENGYGYAPTSMRSPIFYDSDNSNYYANFAAGNTATALKVNGQIVRDGFATGDVTTNKLLVPQDANHWVWTPANNWGMFWATTTSSLSHFGSANPNEVIFVGAGDPKAAIDLDNGDAWFKREVSAGSFAISGGNENLNLLKQYGTGIADDTLFDGNDYWEKRVIQTLTGIENPPTTTTSEYTKNNNGPFNASYALRTSGYRTFDSDFIAVEPGEEIYGEVSARFISGSGGLLYMGVRRYDKDKKPIATNDGITYFVVGGNNLTDTNWRTFSGHHTLPTSHTPYNGSDGGAVKYVRLILLMNYSAGGAIREFGPPILKRSQLRANIRTTSNVYAPRYYDSDDNTFYLDPASTSKLNTVDASNFRDRDNTARYMDPASGGNVQGTWNWNNGTIDNLNNLTFNDPGPQEGIRWKGGNDWKIYESPDNLSTNSGGNLQFTSGTGNGTMRMRVDSVGDVWAGRYMRAQRFYDSNDGNYYADPAGSSIFANLYLRTGGLKLQRDYNENAIWFNSGTDTNHVLWNNYYGGPTTRGAAGSGGFDGMYWNTYQGLRIRGGSAGAFDIARFNTNGPGNGNAHFVQLYADNVEQLGTRGGYGYAPNSMRSPLFYDQDDTSYYGNFAGTSITNVMQANRFQTPNGWDIYDTNGEELNIRSNNSDHGQIIFRDSDSTDCGRIYFDDDNHFGLKTPSNEWAVYIERDARVYLYYNGTWEERTASGYMEARGSYRAPIFYDSNDTGFYANPNSTSRFRGLTVLEDITAPGITGSSGSLRRRDNRIIAPSEDTAGELKFGFTSWNNDNASPYADYLHLRSYTDASGGSDNLLMFKKSGRQMRLWQQSWGSSTAYSSYSNIAVYNSNPDGSGNDLYASRYYDENNTSYYMDPASTSIVNITRHASGGYTEYQTSGGNIRGYIQATESNDAHLIIATSGGEDISFRDGGLGGQWNMIIRGDGNVLTLGSNYAQQYYDRNDTNYYGDFGGTSIINYIDLRGKLYFKGRHADSAGSSSYISPSHLGGKLRDMLNNTAAEFHSGNDQPITIYFRSGVNAPSDFAYISYDPDYDNSGENGALVLGAENDGTGSSDYIRLQARTVVDADQYSSDNTEIMEWYRGSTRYGRLNTDYLWHSSDIRSPIFYDSNDTNYYVDPNGTSRMNQVRANYFTNDGSVSSDDRFGLYWDSGRSEAYAIFREGGGWSYRYPDLRIAFHTGIKLGANADYNGIRFYNDYNMAGQVMSVNNATDPLGGNNVYVNNSLQAGSSLRAPIFYDSNNTTYYINPADSGRAARLRGYIQIDGDNNDTWLTMQSASNGYARIRMFGYAGDPCIEFSDATNSAGQDQVWALGADDRYVGSFVIRWGNNSPFPQDWTSHGSEYFQLKHNGNLSLSGGEPDSYRLHVGGVAYASSSMRSPIFYDSDNTGYYVNPASGSNFNSYIRATEIYARNWFRNDNSREGIYNQGTGVHAYSYQGQYYAITGNNNSSSMSLQLRAAYNGTMCRWMYGDRTWSGDLNAAGQWQLQTRHQDGYSPTLRFIESSNESWTGNIGNDAGKLEYHSNRFYLESGGNSSLIVQFRRNGSNRSYIDNNGLYVGTATSARWADLAERYRADDIYEPGTVLGINLDGDSEVTLFQPGMPLAGAVSTNPAVQMNDMGIKPDSKSKKAKMNPFIALKGRIPVLINGTAKKGQWIIADKDGRGKAVDYGTKDINTFEIIGVAVGDCDGNGEVEVKV